MKEYDFDTQLAFSKGVREADDVETIKSLLTGCVKCVKSSPREERFGVDYVATLRRGATVMIDAKARASGAKQYWGKDGPDFALEIWSVIPTGSGQREAGWALSEKSLADMILFTFDSQDSEEAYLLAFQPLRMALRANYDAWRKRFKVAQQRSQKGDLVWISECVFVPATAVLHSMQAVSRGRKQSAIGAMVCSRCKTSSEELVSGHLCPPCAMEQRLACNARANLGQGAQ